MKKILVLNVLFFGALFLSGCDQYSVNQAQPVTTDQVTQQPATQSATNQQASQ